MNLQDVRNKIIQDFGKVSSVMKGYSRMATIVEGSSGKKVIIDVPIGDCKTPTKQYHLINQELDLISSHSYVRLTKSAGVLRNMIERVSSDDDISLYYDGDVNIVPKSVASLFIDEIPKVSLNVSERYLLMRFLSNIDEDDIVNIGISLENDCTLLISNKFFRIKFNISKSLEKYVNKYPNDNQENNSKLSFGCEHRDIMGHLDRPKDHIIVSKDMGIQVNWDSPFVKESVEGLMKKFKDV